MTLIFENAISYNESNHAVHKEAKRLLKLQDEITQKLNLSDEGMKKLDAIDFARLESRKRDGG